MTRVIINADDLGVNSHVNKHIEDFIRNGLISSATILAVGEALDDAVRIAQTYKNVSFGIHLCLDEFNSVSNSSILKKYGIIDDNNNFTKEGIYKIKNPSRELKQAIYHELKAQVKVLIGKGVKISHFDSHHHFHAKSLWMLQIVSKISSEYNINKIRRPFSDSLKIRQNLKSTANNFQEIKISSTQKHTGVLKRLNRAIVLFNKLLLEKLWVQKAQKSFKITDAFYSYYVLSDLYSELRPKGKYNLIELMCHPGHPEYEYETELIKRLSLNEKLEYKLINYNQL